MFLLLINKAFLEYIQDRIQRFLVIALRSGRSKCLINFYEDPVKPGIPLFQKAIAYLLQRSLQLVNLGAIEENMLLIDDFLHKNALNNPFSAFHPSTFSQSMERIQSSQPILLTVLQPLLFKLTKSRLLVPEFLEVHANIEKSRLFPPDPLYSRLRQLASTSQGTSTPRSLQNLRRQNLRLFFLATEIPYLVSSIFEVVNDFLDGCQPIHFFLVYLAVYIIVHLQRRSVGHTQSGLCEFRPSGSVEISRIYIGVHLDILQHTLFNSGCPSPVIVNFWGLLSYSKNFSISYIIIDFINLLVLLNVFIVMSLTALQCIILCLL